MTKKIYIKSFGCQMNVRDSEIVCGLLTNAGFNIADNDKDADVIIFNTCSVRKHAEDRIWSLIGSYKGKKIIGLIGCMAQNYKEKAFERDPGIRFVVGPQDIEKIPSIIERLFKNQIVSPPELALREIEVEKMGSGPKARGQSPLLERKIWETDSNIRPEEIYHTGFYHNKNHAYVVISEGCSNFCSYCVVPYVRGPLRHRKKEKIIEEIRAALDKGINKITLLGQNVNAYQDGDVNFPKLLELINGLDGLKGFDFFTSHPKDASADLFKSIRDLDKLSKALHLPLQSGSDRILKLMKRGYTGKDYLDLIDSYRKIVTGGSLSSDVIVGFPSETESEFKDTYEMVKKARFNAAYIFKYSPRPKTEAAGIPETITREEKEGRHKKLLELQRKISNEKN